MADASTSKLELSARAPERSSDGVDGIAMSWSGDRERSARTTRRRRRRSEDSAWQWIWCWKRASRAAKRPSGVNASRDDDGERSTSRASASSALYPLHEQQQLKQQIAHYSTMRVHMKRVQLCLEREKRNKFYKELVVYLGFLAVVMATLLTLPVHFPFEQNAALSSTYFQEQVASDAPLKTFYTVSSEREMWQWVQGPMLSQFYSSPLRNSRAIGSIEMRTGRVKGALCRQTAGRQDFVMFTDEICYPAFSSRNEMKEPYGNDSGVLGAQYQWTGQLSKLLRSETFDAGLVGHDMDYGHGGYAVYLPRDNYTAAIALAQQLQSDFLRDDTRYLVSTFAFYNARSNVFSHVQGLFEMSNTDYMEVTGRIKSFRIAASYKDTREFLDANALVIVLLAATLLLMTREISDLRNFGLRKYVQSLWNLLDMLQLVLLIVFLTHWVIFIVRSENIRDDLYRVGDMDCSGPAEDQESARTCFVDIDQLAWLFRTVNNYAAALGLVSVAIVFKYLRLNSRLNLLWRTLRFAAKDLLAFVIIFFTIFFGFAVMGFLTFGTGVRQYHSLSVSLTSCFQMLLGAFDYEEIHVANPTMAAIFFFSFMIAIYLICINMFIAIMSEYYSLAQNEKKALEENVRQNIVESSRENKKDEDFYDSLQFMDVEYDLAKQVKNCINGLRIRVKMPPVKDGKSVHVTEQLVLRGAQRVLLVDYDYLISERKRLHRKFRACVHLIMVCSDLMRQSDPDFVMQVEMEMIGERLRPRSDSTESSADLVEFPVTYVPLASSLASTVEVLKRLKRGMVIEIDDGSLTHDQITLEVLGDQDEYVPSCSRYPPQSMEIDDDYREANDGFRVRISEGASAVDVTGNRCSSKFGLQRNHPTIGGPGHIRACRVLYNGNALLDGNEVCLMPRSTWFRYFVEFVAWGFVKRHATCTRKKKTAPRRLVTDAEVDQLIQESFAAPGRGISCRFDELVRNFRMFIAKKMHTRHLAIPNLEERIFQEVITFLERFPSAVTPLETRELGGYKYTPQPLDTRHIRLPHSINLLTELLSQHAHEVWSVGRIEQGWRWGPQRDNDLKLHPDLVPYEALTEQDKQYDRDTSMSALKVITALGYVLEPPARSNERLDGFAFGTAATAAEGSSTYVPRPIPTDDVHVPPHLRSVIELLAENTHEVWAAMRMAQGWRFGPRRHDGRKEHDGLVPYMYLTPDEKQMDRNTALQTVKLILRCGFTFVPKERHRPRGGGGRLKAVGRNENPDARTVKEAVTMARGATRAKVAFLGRAPP